MILSLKFPIASYFKKNKENYLIPTSSNAGRLLEREYTIWPSRMSGSGWLALN